MKELFLNYPHIIVFLHVLSAVIWVGGMIAVRFAVHPVLQRVQDSQLRLGLALDVTGRLFNIVLFFIFISLITAIIMLKGSGLTGMSVYIKEGIWTVMTLNYAYMYVAKMRATKLFHEGSSELAKEKISLLPNVLLPLNIILGILAIYLGATLQTY